MSPAPRVLVVEDDPLTRSTMALALGSSGIRVVGEAANAAQALSIVTGTDVDVALIDLDLGSGPSGVDLANELRRRNPLVGIIILTSYDDPRLLDSGIKSLPNGATYLRKKQVSSTRELHKAVVQAARNPLNPGTQPASKTHDLTSGQFALLRDITFGLTNKQIATKSGVTVSAVEKAIRRLAKAVGVDQSSGNSRALIIKEYLSMTGRDVGTEH